jgi:hypothetical protein
MRSYDSQFSDNRPLKRTREEKEKLLRELKETYHSLKPHTSPELKTAIAGRIRELMADLAAPPPPPRERRPNHPGAEFGTHRAPRKPRPPVTEG